MTLLIATINPYQAIVVADRRLTIRGNRFCEAEGREENTNKGFLLTCDNARMVVCFTGLAAWGLFVTREWLAKTLVKMQGPDYEIDGIVAELTEKATEKIEALALPPEDRRLSIVMAGYIYDDGVPKGAAFHISNFDQTKDPTLEPSDKARGNFVDERYVASRPSPPDSALVLAVGADRALMDENWEGVTKLVQERRSVKAITSRAVHAIRSANEKTVVVGRECMSLVVSPDPHVVPISEFHADEPVRVVHGFGSIDVRTGSGGIIVDTPEMWSQLPDGTPVLIGGQQRGRKIGRNDPCPCKSGKKYKKCCG